jgi:hypothetical protein
VNDNPRKPLSDDVALERMVIDNPEEFSLDILKKIRDVLEDEEA